MNLFDLPAYTFTSVAEAVAATCSVPGEPEGESARRAVIASEYLGETDGDTSRLTTLSADQLNELIANVRHVIRLVGHYQDYFTPEEIESVSDDKEWTEDELMASYGLQLKQFLIQLEQLSA